MERIFKGQSALRLTLKTFTDLGEIEKIIIRYRKPNGKTGRFDAWVTDAENGVISHECIEGEIDVSGWWVFWAYIVYADGRTAAGTPAKVYVWEEGGNS